MKGLSFCMNPSGAPKNVQKIAEAGRTYFYRERNTRSRSEIFIVKDDEVDVYFESDRFKYACYGAKSGATYCGWLR